MKMNKIISLILTIVMLVSCCAILGSCDLFGGKKETITLWVSEKEGVTTLTQTQIDRFIEANPEYKGKYEFQISGVSEADVGSQVLNDVATAPDIYCFAQDQLARLVQASALLQPGVSATNTIKSSNDAGAVAAASVGGTVYAYPMTSDNGYYLYYDTSVITNPDSLEQMIEDCLAAEANKNENYQFRFALENAWYTASFFFATGCHSTWSMDQDGNYTTVDDDFNSEAGLVAMKGMQKLVSTSIYNSDADHFEKAAAIVTGIWNAGTAEEYFGENLGVADLPSFTVDGTTYHLGSYSGNKLIGVKPSTDVERNAFCSALALYLSNEECQLERFESQQWGPSNLAAQQNTAVQANASLAALAAQNAYATPQGNIHGSWWDLAKVLGAEAKKTTDAELKDALVTYENAINALLTMTDEQKLRWGVIGAVSGTSWDTDFTMTEVETGVWESDDYLVFAEGAEFVMRRGGDWNFKVGLGGEIRWDGEADIGNIKFNDFGVAAGKYKVRFTWDSDPEHNATVTLIPEN